MQDTVYDLLFASTEQREDFVNIIINSQRTQARPMSEEMTPSAAWTPPSLGPKKVSKATGLRLPGGHLDDDRLTFRHSTIEEYHNSNNSKEQQQLTGKKTKIEAKEAIAAPVTPTGNPLFSPQITAKRTVMKNVIPLVARLEP
jgi:hypothetical protein